MSKKNRSLNVGPFDEAAKNVYEISSNMFLAYVLQESLDKYEQAKKEYAAALSGSATAADLQQKKMMVDVCMTSVNIAAQVFDYEGGASCD